ncbi:hypothetical protein BZA70DRAFT_198253 [Myxozyma melibiosi]|uniref:Secreted protein n=1 Tax=Myxozyma melibiosi TaxID=54550 RepID=A0ABR1F2F8_9ASCO
MLDRGLILLFTNCLYFELAWSAISSVYCICRACLRSIQGPEPVNKSCIITTAGEDNTSMLSEEDRKEEVEGRCLQEADSCDDMRAYRIHVTTRA